MAKILVFLFISYNYFWLFFSLIHDAEFILGFILICFVLLLLNFNFFIKGFENNLIVLYKFLKLLFIKSLRYFLICYAFFLYIIYEIYGLFNFIYFIFSGNAIKLFFIKIHNLIESSFVSFVYDKIFLLNQFWFYKFIFQFIKEMFFNFFLYKSVFFSNYSQNNGLVLKKNFVDL